MSLVAGLSQQSDQVLELLANPPLFHERLTQYRQARDEAEAKISLVAPADDILRLRAEAQEALNQAETLKKEAKELREKTISRAKAEAEELIIAAKAEAAKLKAEAHELRNTAQVKMSELDASFVEAKASKAELTSARASLDLRLTLASEAETAAKAREAQFSEKLTKIQSLTADFSLSLQALSSGV
jgi:hypothetical protein